MIMDVKGRQSSKPSEIQDDQVDDRENVMIMGEEDLRRGPWTIEEDFALMDYISSHGEGHWNSLARCAGLKRTGKSCRLRWLNYLRPDVRRGNITLEEQLLILELHSRWGNRWSKIAQYLPGRTDNEIKNYWRTRVQKHAKQLKCEVNSKQFKDAMRYLWMPRLVERIQAAAAAKASSFPSTSATGTFSSSMTTIDTRPNFMVAPNFPQGDVTPDNSSTAASSDSFRTQFSTGSNSLDHFNGPAIMDCSQPAAINSSITSPNFMVAPNFPRGDATPDNSSTAASSDSFRTQFSPGSNSLDHFKGPPIMACTQPTGINSSITTPSCNFLSYGADFQDNQFWLDEFSDNLWNSGNAWFPQ